MPDIVVEAEVKSDIGKFSKDLNKATDNTKNLTGAFRALGGVVSATQGIMRLFGKESDDVEKAILKVQAAMALNQGVITITSAGKSIRALAASTMRWGVVQKAVAAGQKLWNLAIAANPIGLMVAGVAALIAGGAALANYFKTNSQKLKENTREINKNAKALREQTRDLKRNRKEVKEYQTHQVNMAKASGNSADEIRRLERNQAGYNVQLAEGDKAIAKATASQHELALAKMITNDVDESLIEKQTELVKEANKSLKTQTENLQNALDARTALNRKHTEQIKGEETKANNEAADRRRANREREKEEEQQAAEDKLQRERDLQEELRNIRLDAANQQVLDEAELLDKFNESQLTQEEREKNAIYDKYFAIIEGAEEGSETRKQLEENLQSEITATEKKFSEKRKKVDDAETDVKKQNKLDQAAAFGALAGALSSLAGDNKELAAASAIIDTYVGANKAFAQGGMLGYVGAAAVIASGLANVQKIYATDAGDGGGGGASISSAGAAPPAPQMASGSFTLGGGVAPEPLQAFVVTDEMTNSQNQLANIRRRSSL